ncbi:MAG: topoisomerase DNA-binding C4 zinc finger domain-containing protein [Pseudomonadales bacterium]
MSCPRCSSLMVRRHARLGAHAGTTFWGCSRFPRCRGTRNGA